VECGRFIIERKKFIVLEQTRGLKAPKRDLNTKETGDEVLIVLSSNNRHWATGRRMSRLNQQIRCLNVKYTKLILVGGRKGLRCGGSLDGMICGPGGRLPL